jgi:hypothetical protein
MGNLVSVMLDLEDRVITSRYVLLSSTFFTGNEG